VIPDDLNPTAWEAACRNAKGRVETFRNIGGIAKDRRAESFGASETATGSLVAAWLLLGFQGSAEALGLSDLMRSRNGNQKPNLVPEI